MQRVGTLFYSDDHIIRKESLCTAVQYNLRVCLCCIFGNISNLSPNTVFVNVPAVWLTALAARGNEAVLPVWCATLGNIRNSRLSTYGNTWCDEALVSSWQAERLQTSSKICFEMKLGGAVGREKHGDNFVKV